MSCMPSPCAPPQIVGHESGALFDPRVIVDDDEEDAWSSVEMTGCGDLEVRICVVPAHPPTTYYVCIRSSEKLHRAPSVVAAHGHLLLIDAADDPANWLVYRANSSRSWLRRLPYVAAHIGWPDNRVGIVSLANDDDNFIVANLQVCETKDFDPVTLCGKEISRLVRYSSTTEQWELKPLPLPYQGDELKPYLWDTDSVFSASDGSMYFVDLHRGLLRCNVAADDPQLQFIRFPEIQVWTEPVHFCQGRLHPEAYRTAGTTCNGTIMFVDVDNGFFGTRKQSGFTVTLWALKMPELEWDKISVLRVDDELWTLPNFADSPLPRWVPQYPMLSTRDDHVVHFILQQQWCHHEDWFITIDMHHKQLLSYKHRTFGS